MDGFNYTFIKPNLNEMNNGGIHFFDKINNNNNFFGENVRRICVK